ncbi:MAG: 4-hydroxybenzoate polyprenyltransferase [Candidatus Pelagibacter sp. TMED165]|nr:MAG: 4-hydroxybenzoate polyprenyltransferase [Candidatus Pelagibacter sp. TMED165]
MTIYYNFIHLTRLNKPIGFILLFWPCSWGLSLAYKENGDLNTLVYFLALFFLGSVLMRSAGCIVNDIVDKDLDKKVKRTKNRPIASGAVSMRRGFIYVFLLCALAFLILIQFNKITIILGLCSMILAFSYPFMKRLTYWPQLFLGLTFNWGAVMAWTSLTGYISLEIAILYIAAIFWTLGYDTIYGAQDIEDDEIIGVKSTSIKFKKNLKLFVVCSYLITLSLLIYIFSKSFGLNLLTIMILAFFISLIYQIKIFETKKPQTCMRAFKANGISGLLLFLGILSNSMIL